MLGFNYISKANGEQSKSREHIFFVLCVLNVRHVKIIMVIHYCFQALQMLFCSENRRFLIILAHCINT